MACAPLRPQNPTVTLAMTTRNLQRQVHVLLGPVALGLGLLKLVVGSEAPVPRAITTQKMVSQGGAR